MESLYDE